MVFSSYGNQREAPQGNSHEPGHGALSFYPHDIQDVLNRCAMPRSQKKDEEGWTACTRQIGIGWLKEDME